MNFHKDFLMIIHVNNCMFEIRISLCRHAQLLLIAQLTQRISFVSCVWFLPMYNVLKMQEANETRSNSQPNYCCIDIDDDDIKIVKAIVRPTDQTDDDEIVCTFMKSSCKTNEVSVIQSIPSGTELPRPQSIEPVEVTNPVTNNPDDSIVELARVEGRSGSANGTHQTGPLSRILNRRRRSRTSGRSSK